jgi:hypothetical protein
LGVGPLSGARKRFRKRHRRGQALIEFAIIALVSYLLLAAIITFGLQLYGAQGMQQVADLAAREISRTPLPPTMTLDEVLYGSVTDFPSLSDFRQRVFDPQFLVIPDEGLSGLIGQLPLVNQQLLPYMIPDVIDDAAVLRYPGAVFSGANGSYEVWIPLVVGRSADGTETVDWVRPLEEIKPSSGPSPFSVTSPQAGIVALRVNYPVQSPAMSSFRENAAGPFEPTIGQPNVANDAGVGVQDTDGNTPSGTALPGQQPTYAGPYGLGTQQALGSQQLTGGQPVRPFRRVITAQAIFRREVIGP